VSKCTCSQSSNALFLIFCLTILLRRIVKRSSATSTWASTVKAAHPLLNIPTMASIISLLFFALFDFQSSLFRIQKAGSRSWNPYSLSYAVNFDVAAYNTGKWTVCRLVCKCGGTMRKRNILCLQNLCIYFRYFCDAFVVNSLASWFDRFSADVRG